VGQRFSESGDKHAGAMMGLDCKASNKTTFGIGFALRLGDEIGSSAPTCQSMRGEVKWLGYKQTSQRLREMIVSVVSIGRN
jgi:hypothetical protein